MNAIDLKSRGYMFVIAVTTLMMHSTLASAESPGNECFTDDECGEGLVCGDPFGSRCISEDEVCFVSDDCLGGLICDRMTSSCPPEGDRCATDEMGFCVEVPTDFCQGDSDCPEDELCWITFLRECAQGDTLCEAPEYATCVNWARLCGPGSPTKCAAQESCIDGRCVWDGFEVQAAGIERDADKETRLRPLWEEGRCAVDNTGCEEPDDGGGCVAVKGPTFFALLLLPLLLRRKH